MNSNAANQVTSLDCTSYRFETRKTKMSPFAIYANIEKRRQSELESQLDRLKTVQSWWLETESVLKGEEKSFVNNFHKRSFHLARREKVITSSVVLEKRREALKKLFCQDEIGFEMELQAIGKSISAEYREMELIGFTSTFNEIKNVIFTNLLLLGFDNAPDLNAQGIKFDKDMFDDTNKVGAEAILNFLFTRLNPELANEEFKSCYPVLDKTQDQCFRKVCGNWILNIAKENREFDFPSAVSSILMKKGGKKFYLLLFSLSRYVLYEVAKNELDESYVSRIVPPTYLKKMNTIDEAKKKIFQALLDQHANNFVKSQQFIVDSVKEDRLEPFIAQYYNLKKKIKIAESHLESVLLELEVSSSSHMKIMSGEYCEEWNKLINTTRKKEEKINCDWEAIESVLITKRKLWDSCGSVLFEKKPPLVLDGELIKEMLPHSLDTNQSDQRLCLTKLSEAWLVTLEFLASQLEQIVLPKINIISDDVLILHSNQLQNVDKLLTNVADMVSNAREEFSNWCCRGSFTGSEDEFKQIGSSGLCLPSPPINFGAIAKREQQSTPTNSSSIFGYRSDARIRSRHNFFPSSTRVSKKTSSLNQIKKVASEKSAFLDNHRATASVASSDFFDSGIDVSHFDVERDFNLNILESPLRDHFTSNDNLIPFSSGDSASRIPLRFLKVLIKMKKEDSSGDDCESRFTTDGKISSASECASEESEFAFAAPPPAITNSDSGSPVDIMFNRLALSERSHPTKSSREYSTETSLSRANLSLVDIFGEDDTCLIPSTP